MSTVIETKDLTESINGSGVFDTLMASLKDHLQVEFEKGRITGVNYSNVYLGGLTVVMQQSIEFLLRKDQAAAQVDLTKAQITNVDADTDFKNTQNLLAQEQIENTKADTEYRKVQTSLALVQTDIAKKELELKEKELSLADKEIALKAVELSLSQKELELRTVQLNLSEKELVLKDKEISLAEKQLVKLNEEIVLMQKQVLKTDSEIELLNAKAATEKGQTSDSVNAGLIGAQRRLYEAQTTGFTNDHNYKMTKVRADIYSVMLSQDPDALWTNPPPNWVLG